MGMLAIRRAVVWFPLALALVACAAGPSAPPVLTSASTPLADAEHTVFITSNGWHSAIVIALVDLPPGRIPETADFPAARFLEFGWGDAEYYPAKSATFAMTLRAALLPTPAVVHVAGLALIPAQRYPKAEVVPLSLDGRRLGRLVDFIDASFDRGGRARAFASGPGLYENSRFYPALGRFHLLNTCNTWTARALASAGFAITDANTTSAADLMGQVRSLVAQH